MGKKNKNKSAAPAAPAAAAPAGKPAAAAPAAKAAPKKQEAKPAAAAAPKKQAPAAAAAPKPKEKTAAKAAPAAAKPAAASAPPAKKAKVEPKKAVPEPKAVSASEGEDDEEADSDDEDEEGIELDVEALNAMIEIGGKLEDLKDAEEVESVEATLKVVAKYIPKRTALYEERKKAIAKLDKFWGFVISENEDLESMIDNENDLVLISALEDISVKYNEQNPATYQIKFTFAPNEYLSGNSITVNVTASSEQEATVKVTPIQWKKGKNFTAPSTNEPANKKKRAAEYDGFLHFFVNPQEAGSDDFFNIIAHDVYPNALELFLRSRGLLPDGDSDSDEDGEGFQFDEMDSDDEEEMEEDDE